LIALGNLALSSYKTTELKNEKEAWKNKMLLILNKLENVLISGDEEEIANDYLFLSNAIEQTLKRRKMERAFSLLKNPSAKLEYFLLIQVSNTFTIVQL
jgi:uncharacterized membrane protein YgaE (UPF0421/DUF939 family)